MLSSHLYYRFKPYLPWRLRMAARRVVARVQRRRSSRTWPINEMAGRLPADWPGWPAGKKFALVLTHDVEGARGLAKCRELMEAERRLGFRSSFNFIPEGEYQVSAAQREELTAAGFEVGVHDLRHDGKLYWRRSEFPENARSINGYLKEWRAAGFRSGFMLHDRDCLYGLNIEYDASTFDTDPFEPQPEGTFTIFPFWVPRPGGGGYVEMPYTLPQDSTMFLVLQETTTDIWERKLAWIAQRGGMALLNVHPDYVSFERRKNDGSEYPAALYEQFLKHINANYAGMFWNALPREVAGWYRETCVNISDRPVPAPAGQATESHTEMLRRSALRGKRAAIVLYSYYSTDPRPRREAEALQRAGMEVEVLSLRPSADRPRRQRLNGVDVFEMPLKRRRAGKLVYIAQYAWFLTCAFSVLAVRCVRRRYQLVHVHNMPDFLVFSALAPRLAGAKIILDLHDPMPELFRSIYNLPEEHFIVHWLKKMERRSIAFADLVLTPNLAFKNLFTSRSCPVGKIETVMNSPEASIFDPQKFIPVNGRPAKDKPFVLMYHGLIVERHGLDLAIRAVARVRSRIPGLQLRLYGEPTDYSKKIMSLVRELKLDSVVHPHGFQPLEEIARDISQIDLGVIPNRLSSFTEINFPTRIFEYLAMHKPVMVPVTKGINDYFKADEILYFEAGSVDNLAVKIEWAYQHPVELQDIMERGRRIYERHRWSLEENKLVELVGRLTAESMVANLGKSA
ncbi:MAG TPA: glycosyltransferase, partial [Candidatus Acidoferrales bacterium]|nr:glycosyltransferase [Candidatus Acidoferrales bacterium]